MHGMRLIAIACALAALCLGSAVLADDPVLSYVFFGKAMQGDRPVEAGTIIEARVAGVTIGTTTVTGDEGHWQIAIDAKLFRSGICEAVFYINGQQAGRQTTNCSVDLLLEVSEREPPASPVTRPGVKVADTEDDEPPTSEDDSSPETEDEPPTPKEDSNPETEDEQPTAEEDSSPETERETPEGGDDEQVKLEDSPSGSPSRDAPVDDAPTLVDASAPEAGDGAAEEEDTLAEDAEESAQSRTAPRTPETGSGGLADSPSWTAWVAVPLPFVLLAVILLWWRTRSARS